MGLGGCSGGGGGNRRLDSGYIFRVYVRNSGINDIYASRGLRSKNYMCIKSRNWFPAAQKVLGVLWGEKGIVLLSWHRY